MLLEVRVRSHEHRLVAVDLNGGYVCDGCKQNGRGWRYRCHACNYDMHSFCATAPPSLSHPFTAEDMQLLSIPHVVEGDRLWCSACEKTVSGLRYYHYRSGDALHPNCARLPKPLINNTTFHLSMNLSSPCNLCARTNRGWAYNSAGESIHVRCLIKAIQLCNAPFQLIEAPPSTSYHHRRSKQASTSWGTLQKQPKRRSNHGVIRAICTTTRLLLKVIYALFFGDPSCLVGEVMTMISNS